MKETCVRHFVQDLDKILNTEGFLRSNVSTVNDIFGLNGLEIEDERILCDALTRYVTQNNLNLRNIRKYLRPALTSIRFLTFKAEEIRKFDQILTSHERQSLIKCLESANVRPPKYFNTSRKQRYWREAPSTTSDKHFFYF